MKDAFEILKLFCTVYLGKEYENDYGCLVHCFSNTARAINSSIFGNFPDFMPDRQVQMLKKQREYCSEREREKNINIAAETILISTIFCIVNT